MAQVKAIKEKKEMMADPSNIMQTGFGFWSSKVLLTAVKVELFTALAEKTMSGEEIRRRLCLNGRGLYDFLDALVSLGFLERSGIREYAVYANAADTDLYLDKNKSTYIGGIFEMANNRLYPYWNFLEEGLLKGTPQNEIRTGETSLFEKLYQDKDKTREFVNAMSGIQTGNFVTFAHQFDFSPYKTLCDVGGAGAQLSAHVVTHNPHMRCITFDLPQVSPIAIENVSKMGVANKVQVFSGDYFEDPLPAADVITMGNILHGHGLNDKKMLISKAYEALPKGGSLVVIENIIDDDRRHDTMGLLMSLNMLIETTEGFNFTFEDFELWVSEAGFKETSLMKLTGPTSAAIAIK
jgi:precorrin-6B methylase 2